MSKVAVIARIPLRPGARDEFVSAFQQAIANAHAEDGTLTYVLHTDTKDDDVAWVYELYANQAAFEAHARSDAMKALLPALAPFMEGATHLHVLTPLAGKGL